MPEYLIPAETFKKITEEGLSSVIKSARTARGRGWDFALMEKAPVAVASRCALLELPIATRSPTTFAGLG